MGQCPEHMRVALGRNLASGLRLTRPALYTELLGQFHSRALFSVIPARGNKTRNREKYSTDATCPIIIKGCSTGTPPIHVRISMSATSTQNSIWVRGRNVRPRCLEVCRKGTTIRTRIENSSARTPPSLLGIERKIA